MPWNVEPIPQQIVPKTGWQLQDEYQQRDFDNSLKLAAASRMQTGWDPTAGADREAALAANQQRVGAQLAMTPGVSGPGSPAGYSVFDSPAMAPRHFAGPGGDYTFSPEAAAEQTGETAAISQNRQDSTRFAALTQVPGIDARAAARLVYGRSGILDQPDPQATDAALAEYTRNPSAETAAAALRAGASTNNFRYLQDLEPDPRNPGGAFTTRPKPPVPGTPEYDALRQREEDIRIAGQEKEIKLRADLAPRKTDTATQQLARKKLLLSQIATLSGGDEGKGFDALASDPKLYAEAQTLGVADGEVRAAVQQFRNTQTNRDASAARGVFTSGMAATPEEARTMVPRLRGGTAATGGAPQVMTPQRASWDRAMSVITAKQQAGTPLSDVEQRFLTDHPTRP